MGRSIKKGPFVEDHLLEKIQKAFETEEVTDQKAKGFVKKKAEFSWIL